MVYKLEICSNWLRSCMHPQRLISQGPVRQKSLCNRLDLFHTTASYRCRWGRRNNRPQVEQYSPRKFSGRTKEFRCMWQPLKCTSLHWNCISFLICNTDLKVIDKWLVVTVHTTWRLRDIINACHRRRQSTGHTGKNLRWLLLQVKTPDISSA